MKTPVVFCSLLDHENRNNDSRKTGNGRRSGSFPEAFSMHPQTESLISEDSRLTVNLSAGRIRTFDGLFDPSSRCEDFCHVI